MWLERCRDGSYAVNALHCDVWVVCACIVVCTVACFIGFWGSVFWWKCINLGTHNNIHIQGVYIGNALSRVKMMGELEKEAVALVHLHSCTIATKY